MDYEKKYKEALELMKDCIPDENGLVHIRPCDIFSELKESEDEKIRKDIIFYIAAHYKDGGEKARWLYWLEKQGEQKAICRNNDTTIDGELNKYCCKIYNALHKENGGKLSFARLQNMAMDIYQWCNEQKQEWSEEDEKMLKECSIAISASEQHQELVSEDLLVAANKAWQESEDKESYAETFNDGFVAGAKWHRQHINRRTLEYIYDVCKGVMPSKELFIKCVMRTIKED